MDPRRISELSEAAASGAARRAAADARQRSIQEAMARARGSAVVSPTAQRMHGNTSCTPVTDCS